MFDQGRYILDGKRPPLPDAPELTVAISIIESCWIEVA